jgi:ribosomal protein S12 methylthiotransferase accessory factor
MPIDHWKALVSPKVGVIRNVAPQLRGSEEPIPPYLYTAMLSNFDFRKVDKTERLGAGKGCTQGEAMAAAIGEAIERYCAFQWDMYRTFLAKWKDLSPAAINPAEYVLYSDQQYNTKDWLYTRWQEDQDVTWIRGVELPSGLQVAVPASLVYLVHPVPRQEDYFAPSSSNGLAAGPTLEAAILGGLCELIERDALLIAWMNHLPAIELDLSSAGSLVSGIQKHYARFSVEVRAFVMPSDLPAAVVMALSCDPDPRKPAQIVGMGCHPDPAIALTKALFEMCQGRPSEGKRFADKSPRGRLNHYRDVKTLDDHSAFASLPEQRKEFGFLWEQGRKVRISDLPNPSRSDAVLDLDYCVSKLTAIGERVAYVDLTLPDIAGHGIYVVRTVVTGLQPIHFGHGEERLGGRRLFELPQKLGFADRTRVVTDLNMCPHPLA